MIEKFLASLQEESVDPFIGLTCELAFVRSAVEAGLCPLCGSTLDTSMEALRVFAIVCPSPSCSFIVKPLARSRVSH